MGRIILHDGEVIEDVIRVTDTLDGFIYVRRWVKGANKDTKATKIVNDVIGKDKILRFEDIKVWHKKR